MNGKQTPQDDAFQDGFIDKLANVELSRRKFFAVLGVFLGCNVIKNHHDLTTGGKYPSKILGYFFKPLKIEDVTWTLDMKTCIRTLDVRYNNKSISLSQNELTKEYADTFKQVAKEYPECVSPENPDVLCLKGSLEIPRGSKGFVSFVSKQLDSKLDMNIGEKETNRIQRAISPKKGGFFGPRLTFSFNSHQNNQGPTH